MSTDCFVPTSRVYCGEHSNTWAGTRTFFCKCRSAVAWNICITCKNTPCASPTRQSRSSTGFTKNRVDELLKAGWPQGGENSTWEHCCWRPAVACLLPFSHTQLSYKPRLSHAWISKHTHTHTRLDKPFLLHANMATCIRTKHQLTQTLLSLPMFFQVTTQTNKDYVCYILIVSWQIYKIFLSWVIQHDLVPLDKNPLWNF